MNHMPDIGRKSISKLSALAAYETTGSNHGGVAGRRAGPGERVGIQLSVALLAEKLGKTHELVPSWSKQEEKL